MLEENEIVGWEEKLTTAMLSSDVAGLDALLADDLIFTDHQGRLVSKADDLADHRSGLLQLHRLDVLHRRFGLFEGFAVVAVRTGLAGQYDGVPFSGSFAYTRVWRPWAGGGWQVVAAHCSRVAD